MSVSFLRDIWVTEVKAHFPLFPKLHIELHSSWELQQTPGTTSKQGKRLPCFLSLCPLFPLFPPSLEVSEQRGRKGAREGGDQEGFVCCNLMGPAPQTALLWKVNSDYDAWWVLSMRLNKTSETRWGKTFLSEKLSAEKGRNFRYKLHLFIKDARVNITFAVVSDKWRYLPTRQLSQELYLVWSTVFLFCFFVFDLYLTRQVS
jgi:hypothetical protein